MYIMNRKTMGDKISMRDTNRSHQRGSNEW